MARMSGHTSGAAVVGVTIAMTALAALVVFTRLFTRLWIVREPGLDDMFITLALFFSIATTITMCLQVKYGMGQHMHTLLPPEIVSNFKAFYISIWVYNLSMSCTKFSILLQYLRIFPQRVFRIVCYVLMVIIGIYTCWTFFSAVFACWPIASFWDSRAYPRAKCLNRFAVWFANTGINIAADVAIGVLPLPVLKDLQLPKRQKIALMVVFALGGCTRIISILRLESLYMISKATDITWENPFAAIWSSVEINTGMLCSCLPTLRGAISRIFPRIFGTQRSSSNQKKPSPEASTGISGSAASPQHSLGQQARKSLEALERTLSGIGEGTLSSRASGRRDSTSEEIEIDELGSRSRLHDGQIQVVTVVEQDVEDIGEPWFRAGI